MAEICQLEGFSAPFQAQEHVHFVIRTFALDICYQFGEYMSLGGTFREHMSAKLIYLPGYPRPNCTGPKMPRTAQFMPRTFLATL